MDRGGVEDTRLEAKVKDTKKSEAKAGTALSRTDPLEAKDRNARGQGQGQRHRTQAQEFSKKRSSNFFSGILQKRKTKKVFANFLQGFWHFPT